MADIGKVYLVGTGPGDPGLITVRALELLQAADVVVYDKLIPDGILAKAKSGAELVNAGKQAGKHTLPQDEINSLLCSYAKEGKMVVRLKGGDPFIFGRGGEEALELRKAGIKYEIVCGVTSGAAATAYAGIPITQRGISTSVHFITGHEDPSKSESQVDFESLARLEGTLVFYMGVGKLPMIASELMKFGKSPGTPCAVIQSGTRSGQRTVTGKLSEIADVVKESGIKPPAIICIGEVCKFRDELAWFEDAPLFGKTVVVTRTRSQASGLSIKLREHGAGVIELPTIKIEPAVLSESDLGNIKNISSFDWIVITSQNTIEPLINALFSHDLDLRALAGVKIAAIGNATANALREKGLYADLIPGTFTSEGLLSAFSELPDGVDRKKVLLPRGDLASNELPDGLTALGCDVRSVDMYRIVPADYDPAVFETILNSDIDFITFTSGSTATNFQRMIGIEKFIELSEKASYISIGPVTSEKIRDLGANVRREAVRSDIAGVVEAILIESGVDTE